MNEYNGLVLETNAEKSENEINDDIDIRDRKEGDLLSLEIRYSGQEEYIEKYNNICDQLIEIYSNEPEMKECFEQSKKRNLERIEFSKKLALKFKLDTRTYEQRDEDLRQRLQKLEEESQRRRDELDIIPPLPDFSEWERSFVCG